MSDDITCKANIEKLPSKVLHRTFLQVNEDILAYVFEHKTRNVPPQYLVLHDLLNDEVYRRLEEYERTR